MSGYDSLLVTPLIDRLSLGSSLSTTRAFLKLDMLIDTFVGVLLCVYASLLVCFATIVIISRHIRLNVVEAHLMRTHHGNSCTSHDFAAAGWSPDN